MIHTKKRICYFCTSKHNRYIVKSRKNSRTPKTTLTVVTASSYSNYITLDHLHDDVVDGYVNEFDEKSNKTHYAKSNGRGNGDFLKFCSKNTITR